MDKEIHCQLLKEILVYFNISDKSRNKLIKYTKKPDEKARENIEKFELPPAKNIIGEIKNNIKWFWNSFAEIVKWIYLHGRKAPEQFLYHFTIAFEVLIDAKDSSEEMQEKGLRNLAYCIHYIVDIGTPYHSKRFRDVLNLKEISQIQQSLSEEEFEDYFYSKIIEILLFIDNHSRFENDIIKFWNISDLNKQYKEEIGKAVKIADRSHGFTTLHDLEGFFEEFSLDLKNRVIKYLDNIQEAYIMEDKKKSLNEIDNSYINKEVFDYSKNCIYHISLIISLILNIFFEKND